MPEMYKSLNDAAPYPANQTVLFLGKTKIWYFKSGQGRDMMMGASWLKQYGKLPTKTTLGNTHALLGEVVGEDLDELYNALQGENWSPEGQARELIISKGLEHTSMSMGDIIEVNDKLYIVDTFGFKELK
jgi:hypothetical protein